METNLNDGKLHTFKEIEKVGIQKSAKQFAEGNEVLEKVLLKLWEMGFVTNACCKGQNDKNHNASIKIPYISFNITKQTKGKLLTLAEYVAGSTSSSKPNIYYKNSTVGHCGYEYFVLERTFLTNNNANNMFLSILECLNKMEQKTKLKKNNNKNVRRALSLIEEFSFSDIIDPVVDRIHINIKHNDDCSVMAEDRFYKRITRKINDKTFNKIHNFCKEYLITNDVKIDK